MAQYITDAGLLRILTLLSADMTYVGIQNGASPSAGSSTLNGEYARKPIVSPYFDGNTLVAEAYFDETQGNGTITGFGAFGNEATAAVGTGTLITAADDNFTKTDTESLTLSAEITIRRVNA